ncbi:hypothetical protein ACH4PW_35895 [Streptomyces sp. NPDC017082]|uniref:AMP-binding enzyme n=1 Tax=Streptomyces sp. NPDC017082 TaxID=3364974 RepID=UPI0037979B31
MEPTLYEHPAVQRGVRVGVPDERRGEAVKVVVVRRPDATVTARMSLNRSTILGLVSDLSAAGLVREELPQDTGRAGRPLDTRAVDTRAVDKLEGAEFTDRYTEAAAQIVEAKREEKSLP